MIWSSVSSSTPICFARSADTNGSYATSRIWNAFARSATSLPIRPRPTMPSVLSASSTPSHFERSHRPATSAACACGTLRAWLSSSAIVCSAAEMMFDCGAFTTITPRAVAAGTSTLSSPMPARPTTTRSVPASSTSAVTCVADRMISALAPTIASSSVSGVRSSWTSTVWPAARRRSRPPSAIDSVTRMRAMPACLSATGVRANDLERHVKPGFQGVACRWNRCATRTPPPEPATVLGVSAPTFTIRTLETAAEMASIVTIFQQVWGTTTPIVNVELLRAIEHSGGYVAAAYESGRVIGASFGFLGRHHGEDALHSHVTGILPGVQHGGIGRAMKNHQRVWAGERDIPWITWTFDPLVRRNAWFNIEVLGAARVGVPRRVLRPDDRLDQRPGRERPPARRLAHRRRRHPSRALRRGAP